MAKRNTAGTRVQGRSSASKSPAKPDALEILELEHRRFKTLLAQGETTTVRASKRRRELLDRLISELAAHEWMEEHVLYPALLSYSHTRETLTEGLHEHDGAEALIDELKGIPTADVEWGLKFRALKETLQRHMDHEEKHLFPVARGVFSREELRDLAEQMLASRPPRSAQM